MSPQVTQLKMDPVPPALGHLQPWCCSHLLLPASKICVITPLHSAFEHRHSRTQSGTRISLLSTSAACLRQDERCPRGL